MVEEQLLTSPESVGLDPEKIAVLLTRVQREVDEGLLPGVQVALARNGKLAVLESYGAANADSLFCIFSATKAITSAAAWLLIQDGRLDTSEKVADIIPEFASNEKQAVTVEQLFLHTAGFPSAPFAPLDWNDPMRRMQRFDQWVLNWPPGSRFEYHPTSSMWVIADIIERRAGISFQQFVREQIAQPLGLLDLFVGLPESENFRVLPNEHVGEGLTDEDYTRLGIPKPPVTEVTEEAILNFNNPEIRAVGVPGGGGVMGAGELAMFYQGLLHGGARGNQIWQPETMASVRRVRTGEMRDAMFGKLVNRGLGIIIAGDDERNYRGFGKTNSADTFGHNGAGGQLAWADPATGISLGYCTSGHDRNTLRQGRRGVAISSFAAVCLA